MGLADYGKQAWAGTLFGIGELPTSWYLALLNDAPADEWDGAAVSDLEPADADSYARRPLRPTLDWALSSTGYVTNAVAIEYDTPTSDWGVITHYAILDDPVGGELWFWAPFFEPIYVPADFPAAVGIGSLSIALDNQRPTVVGEL